MSWIDQHPDMAGAFAAIAEAKSRRAEGVPRGDEPPRRGGPRHHHRRASRQDRLHRDRGRARCRMRRRRCWSASTAAPPACRSCAATACSASTRCAPATRSIADTFAGRTKVAREARFDTGEWTTLSTGSPALMSAVVAFDCRVIEIKAVASHDIYFGMVEAIHQGAPGRGAGLSRPRSTSRSDAVRCCLNRMRCSCAISLVANSPHNGRCSIRNGRRPRHVDSGRAEKPPRSRK